VPTSVNTRSNEATSTSSLPATRDATLSSTRTSRTVFGKLRHQIHLQREIGPWQQLSQRSRRRLRGWFRLRSGIRGEIQVPPAHGRIVSLHRDRDLMALPAFAGQLIRGQPDAIQRLAGLRRAPRGDGGGKGRGERRFLERAAERLGDGSVESGAVGGDSL
jgi:hypothetical protein